MNVTVSTKPVVRFSALVLSVLVLVSCTQIPKPQPQMPAVETTPDRLEIDSETLSHFMDGQMYFNQGDYAMAVLEYQDALLADSSISTIHISLAEAYWRLGKEGRSEQQLKLALLKNPDDVEASKMLAHQYIIRKMYTDAEKIYLVLWEKHPQEIDYGYALANIAKVQKKYQSALDTYIKISVRFPDQIIPLENAAQIALATQDMQKAQSLFESLIKLDPNNLEYLKTLSDISILNGNFPRGMDLLVRLIELDSENIEMKLRLGTLYYENNQKEDALAVFESLYDEDNIEPLVLYFLATLMAEKDDLIKSEQYARESISRFPNEPRGYGNLSLVELQHKNVDEAIRILLDGREKATDDFTLNYLLGTCYQLKLDYGTAERYLLKALEIYPDSIHGRQTLALIYDTTEEWMKSDSLYELLIDNDQVNAQTLNNYAYSLAERGVSLNKAKSMAEKAITIEPDNGAYLDTIGWIHFKLGNMSKAHNYVKKAVKLDDTNAVVLEHLGDILIQRNKIQEARDIYKQAYELDPDNLELKTKAGE